MEVTDLAKSLIFFTILDDINQMVNFPRLILGCDSLSLVLSDLFLMLVFALLDLLSMGSYDHVVVSVSIDFP